MAPFQKKKKSNTDISREIVGFTKPKKILFFKTKPKPIYKDTVAAGAMAAEVQAVQGGKVLEVVKPSAKGAPKGLDGYLSKAIASHKGLDLAMREAGINDQLGYAKRIFFLSTVIGAVAAVMAFVGMSFVQMPLNVTLLLSIVLLMAAYLGSFNSLLTGPMKKVKNSGKEIEKDVLFAARDMIVSMRSGMPLFNAMATVSDGYGAASREFGKVIKLVQLGMPISQAIDEVSSKSGSKTFQRLMLQASTSIKVGADVVTAMQEVISDVSQERVIELRRYGQRLNAIAMFYMLFGVIFPSMGVAVAAIMSTFISIFTINDTTLIFAVLGLGFLQFIFLNMITSSRPAFSS